MGWEHTIGSGHVRNTHALSCSPEAVQPVSVEDTAITSVGHVHIWWPLPQRLRCTVKLEFVYEDSFHLSPSQILPFKGDRTVSSGRALVFIPGGSVFAILGPLCWRSR